jgi:hypothetical protein
MANSAQVCVTMFCDNFICNIFVDNDNVCTCISLWAYCLINDSTTNNETNKWQLAHMRLDELVFVMNAGTVIQL